MNWAADLEYIDRNPIKVNKLRKRKDDGNVKPLSVEDLKTFLFSLDKRNYTDSRDYAICLVMLDTGLRTKELLSLRHTDYYKGTRSLTVNKQTAKTRTQRTAYLSATVACALENFLEKKPQNCEPPQ